MNKPGYYFKTHSSASKHDNYNIRLPTVHTILKTSSLQFSWFVWVLISLADDNF